MTIPYHFLRLGYLYILRSLVGNFDSTPTLMNLTFTLDGEHAGSFFHNGSTITRGSQFTAVRATRAPRAQHLRNISLRLGPRDLGIDFVHECCSAHLFVLKTCVLVLSL